MSKIGRYFCPQCHTVNVMTGNCFKCGALVEDRAPEDEEHGDHDDHGSCQEPPTHHYHIDTESRLRGVQSGPLSKKAMFLIGAAALMGLALLMMMGGGQHPQSSAPPPNTTSQKGPEEVNASADKAIAIAVRYGGVR